VLTNLLVFDFVDHPFRFLNAFFFKIAFLIAPNFICHCGVRGSSAGVVFFDPLKEQGYISTSILHEGIKNT
jgi:hypothetical protein